ncbi:MAG: PilZ domain-containing protein [Armatimonadetes bacterium]|nr:PilZ domain-containing protein [Armatimonadota bacterium]
MSYHLAEYAEAGTWERRRERRSPCRFEVECDSGHRARVLDIGRGGMRLHFPQPVDAGFRFRVRATGVFRAQSVPCRTTWMAGQERGVQFEGEPVRLLGPWPACNRRKELRVPARLAVHLATIGSRVQSEGLAVNLSIGGATIHTDGGFRVGQLVCVRMGPWPPLPELKVFGRICSLGPAVGEHGHQACGVRFMVRRQAGFQLLLQYFRRVRNEDRPPE